MIEYKKYFPEKEKETKFEKIAYIVEYLKKFELYKFHYFKNSNQVCLVRILSDGTLSNIKQYAKVYNYKLKSGTELPEFWESVS